MEFKSYCHPRYDEYRLSWQILKYLNHYIADGGIGLTLIVGKEEHEPTIPMPSTAVIELTRRTRKEH